MKQTMRTRRVGDQIVRELSSILLGLRPDPAAGLITVTGCEISIDLRLAKIFYSVLGGAGAWERAAEHLDRTKGRIRSELGHRIDLRHTPELMFVADHTAENAERLERVMREERERPKPDDSE